MPDTRKPEFPPIFPAGFHVLDADELELTFVEPFGESERRRFLLQRFLVLVDQVRSWRVPCEVWMDGSWSSLDPEPNDIDALFVFEGPALNGAPPEVQKTIVAVLGRDGHNDTRLRYGCDAYLIVAEDVAMRSYWRGWFGFARSEAPKGIPVLRVYP